MFVHTVLMKIRPGASTAERSDLTQRIGELAQTICGPGEFIIGKNVTEEALDGGFDFGFVLRFPNQAALDAYHVNPAHLAVSLAIRELAEAILVFDMDGLT